MQKYIFYILILIILNSCSLFNKGPKITTDKDIKEEENHLKFTYAFFEGNKHKMLGNYSEAAAYYSKCLQLNKKSAAALYELANIYIFQGDNKSAILLAEEAVKINPEIIWYKLLLGALYDQTNEQDKAINVYKELYKDYPDRFDIKLDYAMLLSKANKYNEALKIYQTIEEQFGISEEIVLEKEKIYIKTGNYSKAYDELNKLIEAFPEEPRYYGLLAEIYVSNKEYDKALDVYNKLLEVDPESGLGHFSLSEYYRILEDYDKSYDELKLAFASPEVSVEIKIKILLNYYVFDTETNKKSQAYELLDILNETHPDNIKVLSVYGDLLIKDDKLTEAREKYKEITKNHKNNFLIWEQLLYIESQLSRYKDMYATSSEALEYFPNQANLYLFKGISASRLKKYDEAIEVLNAGTDLVIDNKPILAQFYSNLAETYNRIKDHKSSDKYFDKALELNPNDKYILNNYSYYLALRNEKLEIAESMIKKCVELAPENSTYLDTYAWVLYKMGKYEEALLIIENAINSGGNKSAVIVEHYGDILYKLNKKDDAVKSWKKAIETGKGSEYLEKKVSEEKLYE